MDYGGVGFNKPFKSYWFRINGEIKSFRFRREEASAKIGTLVEAGAELLSDPFRKGAPVGGHRKTNS